MKVCMIGAGALGSTIGGTLSEGGCDVWLVDPYQAHVDAINRHGLVMRTGEGAEATERSVPVNAVTSVAGLDVVDVVIVLVKAFHTRSAVEQARPVVGPETMIISLQNGLGHEEVLAEVVGREHVLNGTTYVGGRLMGPGRVSSGVAGKQTIIGELDGQMTPRLPQLARAFTNAGLATTPTDNIVGIKWDKLLINVATGALSVITRLPYGQLYRVPEIEACALLAVQEGIDVANAAGVKISGLGPKEIWAEAATGLPSDFKTSMLQSVEAGSRTEIDVINGSVVQWGQRVGVPTPVNSTLVAAVKGIERTLTLNPEHAR